MRRGTIPSVRHRAVTSQAPLASAEMYDPNTRSWSPAAPMGDARYGAVDRITFEESVHGDEVVEGFEAFVQKRPPAWVPDAARPEGRA